MAPSRRTAVSEGLKFGLDTLKDISGSLPAPASSVVGPVVSGIQKIVEIVETIKDNKEQCQLLTDHLLQLLLAILEALKQRPVDSQGIRKIPGELYYKIKRFKAILDAILLEVSEGQDVISPKRKRDKIRGFFTSKSSAADIKKWHDELAWAMQEFNVNLNLNTALHLGEVSGQVKRVLDNQTLAKLRNVEYASFTSARRDSLTTCFEGTREAIILEIIDWIQNPDPNAKRFFWLKGLAGIGKTTIACTVAELAQRFGLLGASFLFSRTGETGLRDPRRVFPTLAYQLALFNPTFHDSIIAALKKHPDAPSSTLKDQLNHLIIEPLLSFKCNQNEAVVVIFDAFDECGRKGAETILRLLVAAIPSLPFLKVFVTSRPEPHIRDVLVPSTNHLLITALHDIEDSVVKNDILLFLRAKIRALPEAKGAAVGPEWATDKEIDELAQAAGKLFIWAATALRSLEDAILRRIQLEALLRLARKNRSDADHDNPFIRLDELYTEALTGTIPTTNKVQTLQLLQTLLGSIVLLRDPLPVDALERLTGMGTGHAVATLSILHSVILPPAPPDNCPRIYHPSFPDYLQDPTRCTDPGLLIKTQKHETRMAVACLKLLNSKLHKGMLGNLDPTLLNSEVKDLEKKVTDAIPLELEYACRFWPSHLAKVPCPEDEDVRALLAIFASIYLLPWLESMSWLGRTREAVGCLKIAYSWVEKSFSSMVTTGLFNDAYRLLLAHFPTITQSALHVARSVLPFAPRNTQLVSTFAEYGDRTVIVTLGIETDWSPCIMTWKSHSSAVYSVAISPDGTGIASSSNDGHVHIHDASSGALVTTLTGHSSRVWSVAFSPDGSRIASGSGDRTVRLWDATTGLELMKSEEHTRAVYTVAFSPRGGRIASGSGDRTILIRDAVAGQVLLTLGGHSNDVVAIRSFPDGGRLVSGSDDQTVRIWDLAGGTCIIVLEGQSDRIWAVAVSIDGSQIASGSANNTTRIWDVSNKNGLITLQGHAASIHSVTFSPSGSRIASASGDSTVRLWDATTGDNVATFRGHTDAVNSVVFTPDGHHVISGSDDATVKIWNASALGEATLCRSSSHSRRVSSMVFSSNGARLASLDWADTVQVWDMVEGRSIMSFPVCEKHDEELDEHWSVHFSRDSSRIILMHGGDHEYPPLVYAASTGIAIKDATFPSLPPPRHIPFEVDAGRLVRNDLSSRTVACILPPSYNVEVASISSFKLDGALGDRIAIGFDDGRVLGLDVAQ